MIRKSKCLAGGARMGKTAGRKGYLAAGGVVEKSQGGTLGRWGCEQGQVFTKMFRGNDVSLRRSHTELYQGISGAICPEPREAGQLTGSTVRAASHGRDRVHEENGER